MRTLKILMLGLALGLLSSPAISAQETLPPESEAETIGPTPPRLSFLDGHVSFFRPGADDWVRAQINTPLSPGDQLYTGSPGNLELQIGPRAFVRAWANTQLGLENNEPAFIQFKVAAGHAALDLRSIEPGLTVEVATPNAAFSIDRPGYYRVDVVGERTDFIARRGGRAMAIPADGEAFSIAPSEEVVIEGEEHPRISSFSAPPLDRWDDWNYTRTDRLLDAESARYVPPGIYGAGDLDRHGRWRVVPEYGPVWLPTGVPAGWAPYSTGAWVHDPYYGWTWVDTAPWGWAPYHYGRWVHVGGFWGWAPGPMIRRPVYAPALVAFFGDPHLQVNIGVGTPRVGWVPLSWGEPCVPWWGRPGFIHRPWWGGWGGPRIVNNVVIHRTTVVKVEDIHVYRNAGVRHGVVAIHKDRFGHGRIAPEHVARLHAEGLRPMHRGPEVRHTPAAFAPTKQRGIRPAEKDLKRPVVATRPHQPIAERGDRMPDVSARGTARRIVPAPQPFKKAEPLPRPPFGKSTIERHPEAGRMQPPVAPKVDGARRTDARSDSRPPSERRLDQRAGPAPQPETPETARRMGPADRRAAPAPAPAQRRIEAPRPARPQLPGEPATRLSTNRAGTRTPQHVARAGNAPPRTEQRQPFKGGGSRAPASSNPPPKDKRPGDSSPPPDSAQ
jgi:hypothetical protein